jgi:hypothetical protein
MVLKDDDTMMDELQLTTPKPLIKVVNQVVQHIEDKPALVLQIYAPESYNG